MNLPNFSNLAELSTILHIDKGKLNQYALFSHRYYFKYVIPKSIGGFRNIQQPNKALKAIQAWILRNILDKLNSSPYATAYILRRSIKDNVFIHKDNRYYVCLDLEDFFPSISFRRIQKIFNLIGYSEKAASVLASLCTFKGSLPQGAVTSPSLSNLVAAKLDRRIAGYTSRRNISYSRYSDDITLSSNNPIVLNLSIDLIKKIINSEHFVVNENKTRISGPKSRCIVTGLIKNNSESRFSVGRDKKKHMRAVIYNFYKKDVIVDKKYKNEASILGWLSYLKLIEEDSFNSFNKYLDFIKK